MAARRRQLLYLTYLDSSRKSYSHCSNKTQSQKCKTSIPSLSPTINHPEALDHPLPSITNFPRFCYRIRIPSKTSRSCTLPITACIASTRKYLFFHSLIGFNFLTIKSPPDNVFYAVSSSLWPFLCSKVNNASIAVLEQFHSYNSALESCVVVSAMKVGNRSLF